MEVNCNEPFPSVSIPWHGYCANATVCAIVNKPLVLIKWRHDIEYNDTQYNDTQCNDTQYNDTQYNNTQYNETQLNDT